MIKDHREQKKLKYPIMNSNLGTQPLVTFVATCNDPALLKNNFEASPAVRNPRVAQVIIQKGFKSAALAYNDAIDRARTDVIIFAHQDVYFPENWLEDLDRALLILETKDPNWAVLGCYGIDRKGKEVGYVYSVGLGVLGHSFAEPVAVDSLDEFVLILRKSANIRFDPTLPNYHFYGTDICLAARKRGLSNFVICAFSVHNTKLAPLPKEFFDCYRHIKRVWKEFIPITTPCIRVSRFDQDLTIRKLKALKNKLLGNPASEGKRLADPREALDSYIPENKP
jgi:hypothetical protein